MADASGRNTWNGLKRTGFSRRKSGLQRSTKVVKGTVSATDVRGGSTGKLLRRKASSGTSTPLGRSRPMRKRSRKRSAPSWKGDPKLQGPWKEEHLTCARCGKRAGEFGTWIELHHIIHGTYGRPNFLWNYLALCNECHPEMHGMAHLEEALKLKKQSDPENYSPTSLVTYLRARGRERAI